MLDRFFGVHPEVVRSGLWAKMKPGEKDLLIYLMAESERCCTRELNRTDAQIHAAVGTAPRTLCDARKKLAEYRLVQCKRAAGNKFLYVICDPTTGAPYPGDAKVPARMAKSVRHERFVANDDQRPKSSPGNTPEVCGLPMTFD